MRGKPIGIAQVKGIASSVRNSPCGSIRWNVSVSSWATMPVISFAWPSWKATSPTMFVKNWCPGEAISWLSVRSNVYFMLCALTTPLAFGEKAKSSRIWNVYVRRSWEIVGIATAISGLRRDGSCSPQGVSG